MPLPDRFLKTTDEDKRAVDRDRVKIQNQINSRLPAIPTFGESAQESAQEWGSTWDFFEQAGLGFASGVSWGLTEFAECWNSR